MHADTAIKKAVEQSVRKSFKKPGLFPVLSGVHPGRA
jgi:hypothetical protein